MQKGRIEQRRKEGKESSRKEVNERREKRYLIDNTTNNTEKMEVSKFWS